MIPTTRTTDQLENFLGTAYEFRRNVVIDKTEFRVKNTDHAFKPFGDYFVNSMRREMKAAGIKAVKSDISSLLNSSFVPKVDVFEEYFKAVHSSSTCTQKAIDKLADTVKTTNQALWAKCLRKWLVAAVACAINPDVVNHQILILVGEQGVGKTQWLHKLLPSTLKGYMYSGHINPNNKDTLVTLTENLFVNLDELASFRGADIDSLKELITKENIQFRRPYATYTENYLRRASFMGSVNHVAFLTDTTGHRRFMPFTAVNIDYKHSVNIDEVYAEAFSLYKQGFKYWFDSNEIAELEANNEQYLQLTMEQELVEKYLAPSEVESETAVAMTTTEIARYFHLADKMPFSNATVQKVGAALRSLGFKRVKRHGNYKYIVSFLSLEQQAA